MATNREEIQYVWKGNNKEALNALAELESKNHDLSASIKDLKLQQEVLRLQGKKNGAEYKALGLEIASLTKTQKANVLAIIEQRKEVGIAGQSTQQLKRNYKELSKELETLTYKSDAYNKTLKNKLAIEKELTTRKVNAAPSQGIFDQLKGAMPSALAGGIAGGMVGLGIGALSAIGDGIRSIIPPMKDLADINSKVKIALNLTDDELINLNKDLKAIDTRSSLNQLKDIAAVAGDLNVPTQEVAGFVTEVDKGAIAFERSFGSAEEYATSIGKLKGMYSDLKDQNYGESINAIGSAMKVLEDDGPATAKGILEFTTRMGQLPESLRPAISDTMALAAVLEEAGLTAEISSGGLSNILLVATKNSAAFAKQLGMTKEEFKELLNNDPNAMLLKLAGSFKGLENTQVGQVMKNLKLESQESVKVLGTLADNTEKVTEKQILSNKALAEGTRLTEIFNEKNNNFAGQMERIGKQLSKLASFVLRPLREDLQSLIVGFGNLIGAFGDGQKPIIDKYKELSNQVNKYDKSLIPLVEKYEQLKAKNPEKNQEELRKIMAQIVGIMPAATTEIDKYGRAISINTERVLELVEALRKQKNEVGNVSMADDLDKAQKAKEERDKKIKLVNDASAKGFTKIQMHDEFKVAGKGGAYETFKTVTVEDLKREVGELTTIYNKSLESYKRKRREAMGHKFTYEKNPTNPFKNDIVIPEGDDKDATRKANEKLKRIQEQAQQELDLQIDVAHQAYLQGLKDEEKKIASIELSAQKKLITLKNQFKDENGLFIEQEKWTVKQKRIYGLQKTQIETETEDKITEIQREAAKKREQQLLDEQQKAVELANATSIAIAQVKVEEATRSGDDLKVFNARFSLLSAQATAEQAKLTDSYTKRRKDLEGNDAALLQFDKNYYAESKNITNKYINEQSQLLADYYKSEQGKKQESLIEKLKLDVDLAEGKGMKAQKDAQIALLMAQMQQELDIADKTGKSKKEIAEKYADLIAKIETAYQQKVASNVVNYFGQAYSILSQFQQTKLQNETQAEDEHHKRKLDNLEKEKERGQITAEQYTQKKTQLEAQHDKKTRAMQRKQAELNKQNQIVQATMAMAKSIVEATNPATMWMIPIIAAMGLAQIGVIAATEIPAYQYGGYTDKPSQKMTSFKKPSPTAQLSWLNEAGTEYVVPADLMNQPAVANMVGIIEAMRTNKAYMNGGFTATQTAGIPSFSAPSSTATQQPVIINMPAEMSAAIEAIAALYKNGVPVYMGGADYRKFHEDYVDFQESNSQSGI